MEPGSNARAVTIIFTFVILRTSCGLSLPLQMFAWFGWQSDGPGQCQAQSSPGILSGFYDITQCHSECRRRKLSSRACSNGEKGVRSVPLDVRLNVFIPGFISSFSLCQRSHRVGWRCFVTTDIDSWCLFLVLKFMFKFFIYPSDRFKQAELSSRYSQQSR